MKSLYLGKWDNWESNAPERGQGVKEVIEAVEEFGAVSVNFDYEGRTRHQIAAHEMASKLPDNYEVEIGYNYLFLIRKKG